MYNSQPAYARVATKHRLYRGLMSYILFSENALPFDVKRKLPVPTMTVGSLTTQFEQFGRSTHFASAVMSYGDITFLDGLTSFSVGMLVKPNSKTTAGLIQKRIGPNDNHAFSIGFEFFYSDTLSCELGAGPVLAYDFSTLAVSTTAYHTFLVVYNLNAGTGNRIKFYLNGSSVSTSGIRNDNSGASIPNTTSPLEVGRVNNGTLYCDVNFGCIALWSRVLDSYDAAVFAQDPFAVVSPKIQALGRFPHTPVTIAKFASYYNSMMSRA